MYTAGWSSCHHSRRLPEAARPRWPRRWWSALRRGCRCCSCGMQHCCGRSAKPASSSSPRCGCTQQLEDLCCGLMLHLIGTSSWHDHLGAPHSASCSSTRCASTSRGKRRGVRLCFIAVSRAGSVVICNNRRSTALDHAAGPPHSSFVHSSIHSRFVAICTRNATRNAAFRVAFPAAGLLRLWRPYSPAAHPLPVPRRLAFWCSVRQPNQHSDNTNIPPTRPRLRKTSKPDTSALLALGSAPDRSCALSTVGHGGV